MPARREKTGQEFWLKVVAALLVAVAMATATNDGNHGTHVATGDPAGCVMLRVS